MFLLTNARLIVLIDVIFLAYGFTRVFFTYLILSKALERRDSRDYKFVALSFVFPFIAFLIYKNILKKECAAE